MKLRIVWLKNISNSSSNNNESRNSRKLFIFITSCKVCSKLWETEAHRHAKICWITFLKGIYRGGIPSLAHFQLMLYVCVCIHLTITKQCIFHRSVLIIVVHTLKPSESVKEWTNKQTTLNNPRERESESRSRRMNEKWHAYIYSSRNVIHNTERAIQLP